MEFVDRLIAMLRNTWNEMTSGQRIVLISMVAAVVVSATVFSTWVRKPEMAVLTSGADMDRIGEIAGSLDAKGVEYKVTNGGRTILVDRTRASQLAVEMAAEGLVGDASGGNILDSKNVGMWPAPVLKDNLRRVLQAELGKMITGLQSVSGAQVQLALPEESVFLDDQRDPSASVLVSLRGKLSPTEVRGIANLVASGVEGLEPDHVSIVDASGKVLWGDSAEEDDASTVRLQKKVEIESHLAAKATRLLEQVVGAGNAAVTVDAALSWDQRETTTESYDPNKVVVRSQERTESNDEGATNESSVTNNEIDKTIQYVSSRGAQIEKLTTSIVVNYRGVTGEDGTVTFEKMTDTELDELRQIAMNAVGYDENRGDNVVLISQQFPETSEPSAGGFVASGLMQSLPSILGRLVAVAIAFMLLMSLRRSLNAPVPASTPSASRAAGANVGVGMGASVSSVGAGLDLVDEDGERVSPEERFQSVAQGSPENVARVMQSWMSE